MTAADLQTLLANLSGAEPGFPFGPDAQVWKVGGKMFAIVAEDVDPPVVSLKCDPDLALELRAQYPDNVIPGYHLNKQHWNTITVTSAVPDGEIADWIAQSYDLVAASLTKKARLALDLEGSRDSRGDRDG